MVLGDFLMNDILLNYFLNYVKIDTMSSEDSNTTPSTMKQFDLARKLVLDLKELGLNPVLDEKNCYVTAELKSNCNSNLAIGFFAHMDTIPGFSGTNVKPQIIKNYDGKEIKLNGITLDPKNFEFLPKLKGKTIITTDGTTVLGADDKAGVSEIMSMLHYFINNPTIPHVNIKVAFTPDEEIGGGLQNFDIKGFNCDYAYTVDGEIYNEVDFENFNAASAVIEIKGLDIHPGNAKGKMINASLVAHEFISMLDSKMRPENTEGYEGFNHLCSIEGICGEAKMEYIIRNHDAKIFNSQKDDFIRIQDELNKKYGENTVKVTIKDQYKNMREWIDLDPRSVIRAKKAIEDLGLVSVSEPIRGGTDGAFLTRNGLNTPNLGTGGYNPHGPYEMACLDEMEMVVKILINIAKEN